MYKIRITRAMAPTCPRCLFNFQNMKIIPSAVAWAHNTGRGGHTSLSGAARVVPYVAKQCLSSNHRGLEGTFKLRES